MKEIDYPVGFDLMEEMGGNVLQAALSKIAGGKAPEVVAEEFTRRIRSSAERVYRSAMAGNVDEENLRAYKNLQAEAWGQKLGLAVING